MEMKQSKDIQAEPAEDVINFELLLVEREGHRVVDIRKVEEVVLGEIKSYPGIIVGVIKDIYEIGDIF